MNFEQKLALQLGTLQIENAKLTQAVEVLKAEIVKRDEIIKAMKEPDLPLNSEKASGHANGAEHDGVA